MKPHVRIYRKFFKIGDQDQPICELRNCYKYIVDIHHIKYKSRGGKDNIENLIGLCRDHHDLAHDEIFKEPFLRDVHLEFTKQNKP